MTDVETLLHQCGQLLARIFDLLNEISVVDFGIVVEVEILYKIVNVVACYNAFIQDFELTNQNVSELDGLNSTSRLWIQSNTGGMELVQQSERGLRLSKEVGECV